MMIGDEFSVITKLSPSLEGSINHQAQVCDFISSSKEQNLDNLKGIIPYYFIHKIRSIHIPILNIADKLIWKSANDGQFSAKIATSANNDAITSS